MQLVDLPSEIVLAIFQHCSSILDVITFSQSCRHIHSLLSASQKFLVLYRVAELQFGPVHDIVQLLSLNSSQPASSSRYPPRSDALLRQIVGVGWLAKRWEEIYPFLRWDSDFADRRSLDGEERYRLRRAVYRYWLYTHAFHTPAAARTARRLPQLVHQRMTMLQNWSTTELLEIKDFQNAMRDMISTRICPSDLLVRAMYQSDSLFSPGCHCKQPTFLSAQDYFHTARGACVVANHSCLDRSTCAGWGDPVTHYYIVEDLLKLDPKAILWLHDHPRKWQVQRYLDSLGEWFFDNGDTFSEALAYLIERREPDSSIEKQYPYFGIVKQDCSSSL